MTHIKLFFIALLVFLFCDAIWLGYITKNLYIQNYQPWLRLNEGELQPLWWSVVIVYILLALSISTFVVPLAAGSLSSAIFYGALMGAIIYGVYDFTCLAIYKDFPIGMAFIDWGWGTAIGALSAIVTVYCYRFIK